MTRTAPINGICPEGTSLTHCIYYNVSKLANGLLSIKQLPINKDPLCGDCEVINPTIVNEWRANNPPPVPFSNIIYLPSIRAALNALLVNGKTSVMLVDQFDAWKPIIRFPWSEEWPSNYYVSTLRTTWAQLHPNICFEGNKNAALPYSEGLASIGTIASKKDTWGNRVIICHSLSEDIDTCPINGFMPWWQCPPVKGAYSCNCTISPTPDREFGCGILYENSVPASYWTRPRPIEQFDTARDFVSTFQKWIDDNKDEELFDHYFGSDIDPYDPESEETEVVVLFWGFIEKAQGQENPKVTLELWKINQTTKKLERIEEALTEDQMNVKRRFIHLIPYSYSPPIKCHSNYLLTYNTNTCSLTESFVESLPEYTIPEVQVIKYIPCTSIPLSESNPTEFNKLVQEFTSIRPECTCACCYVAVDFSGQYIKGCLDLSPAVCKKDYVELLINDNLYIGFDTNNPEFLAREKIVKSVFAHPQGTSCADDGLSCQYFDVPDEPTTRLGTCCYTLPNGEWACAVNVKEQCEYLNGFFSPAQSDGVGGFNTPSCATGGVAAVALDDTTSSVIVLEGTNCDLYPKITPVPDPTDPNTRGSCCSITTEWSGSTGITSLSSLVRSNSTTLPYYGPCVGTTSPRQPSGVTLTMLNDGSIIKLTFEDKAVMDDLYGTEAILANATISPRLIQQIEKNFTIYGNSQETSYKVKFKGIENNSIILSVIK